MHTASNHQRGFTLIELLVVIAIVSTLIALQVPAVQRVRAAAAATQCQNNLKQIALGTIHFHDAFGSYPPARIVERPTGEDPSFLKSGGEHPTWLVRILPFIEQEAAYRQWDCSQPFQDHPIVLRDHVVATYLCPSRRDLADATCPSALGGAMKLPCGCTYQAKPVYGGATGDYAGNHGDLSPGSSGLPTDFQWGGNGTGVIISSRGFQIANEPIRWYDKVRLAHVTDGASNTFLAGEMHVPMGKINQSPDNGPIYDGSRFYHMSRVGGPGVPLAQGPEDNVLGMGLFAFGSWHLGICHFAFADGHVQPVRNQISTTMLERLCHRSDGQPVELP
ncbi:MAG: DUF1559 domain-containing protein [Planctomycetes bacterium]|nr:DUF1559 domain-containing protein [Planctomycetota bacterium]